MRLPVTAFVADLAHQPDRLGGGNKVQPGRPAGDQGNVRQANDAAQGFVQVRRRVQDQQVGANASDGARPRLHFAGMLEGAVNDLHGKVAGLGPVGRGPLGVGVDHGDVLALGREHRG